MKTHAEMRFYNGTELEDVYKTYGVSKEKGALACIRPDGYVGALEALGASGVEGAEKWFRGALRVVDGAETNGNGVH